MEPNETVIQGHEESEQLRVQGSQTQAQGSEVRLAWLPRASQEWPGHLRSKAADSDGNSSSDLNPRERGGSLWRGLGLCIFPSPEPFPEHLQHP